jgi:nucleoid DNA-binding protein
MALNTRATVQDIIDGLTDRGMVSVTGLGVFRVKKLPPRSGLSPNTQTPYSIGERNTVTFRPSPAGRKRVNGQ